jgi:hypothetical protein
MKKYRNTTPRLDLHGVKHKSVEVIVENFVIFSERLPVEIITGQSKIMKDIVIEVLNNYGYKYTIGDFINKGYITVLS